MLQDQKSVFWTSVRGRRFVPTLWPEERVSECVVKAWIALRSAHPRRLGAGCTRSRRYSSQSAGPITRARGVEDFVDGGAPYLEVGLTVDDSSR